MVGLFERGISSPWPRPCFFVMRVLPLGIHALRSAIGQRACRSPLVSDHSPCGISMRRAQSQRCMASITGQAVIYELCLAEWPGNVRQLENTVARMVTLGTGNEIGPEAFRRAANEPAAEPLREGMLSSREQVTTLRLGATG